MADSTSNPQKHFIKTLIPIIGILAVIVIALFVIKKSVKPPVTPEGVVIKEGATLPDFTIHPLEGEPVSISSLKHKVTLVNFWATWCQACVVEIPSIVKLREKFLDRGFGVVFISVDENPMSVVPNMLSKMGVSFPTFFDKDGKNGEFFAVQAIPFTVVLDADRKILFFESGDRNWNASEVHAQMEKWLNP